jgi:hypothetical protein
MTTIPVRQSTAFECAIGPVLDASGVAVTNCVVADFKIKKTTGNFAALNGSATLTHVSVGVYDLVLTTSDVDTVGLATIAIDDTVNACASLYLQVIEEAVYDRDYAAAATGYIANQPVDVNTIKTNPVVNAGTVTFPTTATLASTTNITAGTVTTATNVTTVNGLAAGVITAASIATGAIDADALATDAVTEIQSGLSTLTQTQVTGGAYALNSASFAFNAALDFTTTQKAATLARVTLVDTATVTTTATNLTNLPAITANWLTAAGTAADFTTEIQSGLATAANLATVAGYLDTEIAAILADTNELQTDWADGGRLDLILDARASQASVDDLPTNAELATSQAAADDATLAAIAALNNLSSAQVQTAAAAALTAYDPPTNAEMEARTLLAAEYGTAATQATIAGYLDTEVAAIKAKTDQLTFGVANTLNANIEYVNGVEVTGTGATGDEWGPL